MIKLHKWTVTLLLSFALAVGGVAEAWGAKSSWESLKSEPANLKTIIQETEIELKTSSSNLVIKTDKPVQVQVFTILGQLVSSETVGPGIVRLHVSAHGVYIVKIADRTCKVAL